MKINPEDLGELDKSLKKYCDESVKFITTTANISENNPIIERIKFFSKANPSIISFINSILDVSTPGEFAQLIQSLKAPLESAFKSVIPDNPKPSVEEVMGVMRAFVVFAANTPIPPEIKRFLFTHFYRYFQDSMFVKNNPKLNEGMVPIMSFLEQIIDENAQFAELDFGHIHFKDNFNHMQTRKLKQALKDCRFTNTPQKLIDFLKGDNNAGASINPSKAHHISYLVHLLYKSKIISLNFGKGYYTHFENYVAPFRDKKEKWKMKELKRQVVTAKYNKQDIKAQVDDILADLKRK